MSTFIRPSFDMNGDNVRIQSLFQFEHFVTKFTSFFLFIMSEPKMACQVRFAGEFLPTQIANVLSLSVTVYNIDVVL